MLSSSLRFRASSFLFAAAAAVLLLLLAGCAGEGRPTAAEFTSEAEETLMGHYYDGSRAAWVQSTYINEDTTALAARFGAEALTRAIDFAQEAATYDAASEADEVARKLDLLRGGLTLAAPADEAKIEELSQIATRMEAAYGSGKHCPDGPDTDSCRSLGDLEDVIDNSRDADALLDAWEGWRTISPPIRADYERFVELSNEGARDLGFADTGAMWRSKYDMPPDDFAVEVDRLWDQVKPLYDDLQCHVRAELSDHYGADIVDPAGPIPAHVLGNMWAQSWSNIYDLVAPPAADPGYDLTEILQSRGTSEVEMVEMAEGFFTSLGMESLPDTFWTRSQFVKPRDREVVCHASAWQLDLDEDVRIKMCIDINAEDFSTIHHELGHSYYQLGYRDRAPLFRDSANDGFHEALGDTIALSVTPGYLVDIGLLDEEPSADADLGLLMRMALDKVAFLPFGLLIDRWRWAVFSGETPPEEYNAAWWALREEYQGVGAPSDRTEEHFDPGAKYHVPGNTPYTRYFLAHILQFQLHRDLCAAIGYEGPLNRCSIYGNEEAGRRLSEMMAMGLSRPWPDALEAATGSREMDATAILDYFAPLAEWLREQNQGRTCGWS
jgi:peptidyl-dipeptidase A